MNAVDAHISTPPESIATDRPANKFQQLAGLIGARAWPRWAPMRTLGRGIQALGDAVWWGERDRFATYATYLILLTGGFRLAAVWVPTYNSNLMSRQCKAAALLALALGMLLAPALVRHARDEGLPGRRMLRELPCVLAAALFVGWFILRAGVKQIGGFDHSILVQCGWLQLLGQRPYEDFPCTLPPFFFLGVKYAFQWGGVQWMSLVVLCAAWSLITFAWSYVLLRLLKLSAAMSLVFAVALQAMTMMLTSYWWYNPPLSMAVIVLFLSALVWSDRPRSAEAFCSFLAAVVVLFLDKPNGWPLIVLAFFLFLWSPAHRRRAVLGVVLVTGCVVLIAHLARFSLPGMLASYAGIAASRNPAAKLMIFHGPPEDQTLGFLLAATLVCGILATLVLLRCQQRCWRDVLLSRDTFLCGSAALCGGLLYLTNGETKTIDLAPALAGLVLATFRSIPAVNHSISGILHYGLRLLVVTLIFFLLLVGLVLGWHRYRVRAIGPEMFFQSVLADRSPAIPFFRHVQCGQRLVRIVEQIGTIMAQYPTQSVYFGPRMEWAYAAFGKAVPPHLPIWWDAGTAYPRSAEPSLVERWNRAQFEVLVFLQHRGLPEVNYLPKRLLDEVDAHYRVAEVYKDVMVYRRHTH